jgi:hypothetical protein
MPAFRLLPFALFVATGAGVAGTAQAAKPDALGPALSELCPTFLAGEALGQDGAVDPAFLRYWTDHGFVVSPAPGDYLIRMQHDGARLVAVELDEEAGTPRCRVMLPEMDADDALDAVGDYYAKVGVRKGGARERAEAAGKGPAPVAVYRSVEKGETVATAEANGGTLVVRVKES